jgi:flagellar biosynthesis protein FlhF
MIMVTKKFKAPNMLAALQEVQKNLGPEAIVVSMRQIPSGPVWQVWKKPGCEVIATVAEKGTLNSEKVQDDKTPAIKPMAKAVTRETIEWVIPELGLKTPPPEVKPAPKAPAQTIAPAPVHSPEMDKAEELSAILSEKTLIGKTRARLLAQGVDAGLVDMVVNVCRESLSPGALVDESRLLPAMQKQFEIRLKGFDKFILTSTRRILCLVGPSGAGKTSACAKLATHYVLKEGKNVAWICADTVRTAAIAEARMYTDTLGVPMFTAYTSEDVLLGIQQSQNADLILIDTPGCNPFNESSLVELGTLIADVPNRVTCLVTPATTKETDLNTAVASFGAFKLKGLVVTKMDETNTYGSLYNAIWHNQVPLAYFSMGSKVLDALKQGNPSVLVNALFKGGLNG